MSDVTNLINAPAFDGRAGSFANFEEKVAPRNQISTMDPRERAANLLLHMSDVARKASMTVGKGVIGNLGGVEQISEILRERFAPDAVRARIWTRTKIWTRTDRNSDILISPPKIW